MLTEILEIPLDQILPSEGNRRIGGFDQGKLEHLAESIRAVGVQQPAVVREIADQVNHGGGQQESRYQLVAGERRWRAARIAGLETLPCVVRDLDDVTVLKIQTIENLQREDIHPLDEADGYARLIDRAGYDVEHLAQEIGRSASYVYQRLKLRDLIPAARKLLVDGKTTAGHAILVARLQPAQQEEAVDQLGRYPDMPIRRLDDWIHQTILLELSRAPFKKDDAELLPAAGSCTTCPKRTGFQPALFADVCNKDYCTDPACFNGKLDALVARRRQELAEEKHLEVIDGWLDRRQREAIPKDAKESHEWTETRKKDEGAQRVLIVAGPERGRMTWGVERKTARSGGYQKSSEEKAREKEQKERLQASRQIRRDVWNQVMDSAKDVFLGDFPEPVLRLIALHTWARLWDNHQKIVFKLWGWQKPAQQPGQESWQVPRETEIGAGEVEKMSIQDLRLFLLQCSLVGTLEVSEHSVAEHSQDLLEAAEIFGVDSSTLLDDIEQMEKKQQERYGSYQGDESSDDEDDTDEEPLEFPGEEE